MSDKKIKVLIGLEAQGHIKTINEYFEKHKNYSVKSGSGKEIIMMPKYHKYHWDEIGRIIGWCPFTACLKYFEWLEKNEI